MRFRASMTVASRAAVLLVLLAATPFVVAALGPAGYGVWVVVVAVAGLYGVVDAGFAPALGRVVADARVRGERRAIREAVSTALAGSLAIGVVLLIPAWMVTPAFVDLLAPPPADRESAELAIRVAIVTGVTVNAAAVIDGTLIGLDRIDLLAAVRVAYALLLGGGIALVVAQGGGVDDLAVAQLAAWAVAIAVAGALTRRAFGGPLLGLQAVSRRPLRELLRFGLPPQASRVSMIGALQYERVMVAVLVGAGAAAGYGVASLLVGGLRALMGQAAVPLLPTLTGHASRGDRTSLDRDFARVIARLATGFAASFGVLAATAPAVVHAWVGPAIDDADRYTWILAAGFAASALATTAYALAQAVGRPGIEARAAGVATVGYVVAVAVLLGRFGAAGAAVGTAAGLLAGSAYCFGAVARAGLAPRRVLLAAWLPLLLAAGLAVPFAITNAATVDGEGATRVEALALAAAWGAAYLVALGVLLAATGMLPRTVRDGALRRLGAVARACVRPVAWLALVALAPVLAIAVAIWPTATVLAVAVCGVAYLAWRSPPHALVATVLLYGVEGTLKLRIAAESAPFTGSPEALAAAAIDTCLVLTAVGALGRDRLRTPRLVWARASRLERGGLASIALWLALSLPHVLFAPSLGDALGGLRLTQTYVVAGIAAAVVFARPREQVRGWVTALLAAFAAVAGYAALRVAVGPSEEERAFALAQDSVTEVSTAFRAVGSFSGTVGLESYLVPAVAFCLVLGLLARERRLALAVAALGGVALVGSYGRAPLVAVAAVMAAAAAVLLAGARAPGVRRLAVAAVLAVGMLGLGAGAVVAGTANEKASERARGLIDPLGDESMRMRFESWGESLDEVARKPLGAGLGVVGHASGDTRESKRETDNAFLKVLVEQGVVGALAFALGLLALCAGLARRLGRMPRDEASLGTAALLGFAGFAVLALTGEFFEQPGKVVAWSLLGIAVGQAFAPAIRRGQPT